MTAKDRKKLAQLSRRLKAVEARMERLENLMGALREKWDQLEKKRERLANLYLGLPTGPYRKGRKLTPSRKKGLDRNFATIFKQQKAIKAKIEQLSAKWHELDEQAGYLDENMRRVKKGQKLGENPRSKNPYYVITANKREVIKGVNIAGLDAGNAKDALARAKRSFKGQGYTSMKATKQRNPSRAHLETLQVYVENYVREGLTLKEILSLFRQAGFPNADLKRVNKAYAKAKAKLASNPRKRKRNASAKKTLTKAGRSAKKAVRSALDAGSKLLSAGAKALNNPTRKGLRRGYRRAKDAAKSGIGTPKTIRRIARTRKRAGGKLGSLHESPRYGRKNPTPKQIRKKFAGRVGNSRDLYFPKGTPQGLAKLGKLKLIKTKRGTIKPAGRNPAGEVWLCADTTGKLHLGSTKDAPLFNGPKGSLGEVVKIEYDEKKPHLGYPDNITWYHRMGEESGQRPTLHSDGEGGLYFKGGRYRITKAGIVD
jgi:hypothetical protein